MLSVQRAKLGHRRGFWRKNCESCGQPLATSDIAIRPNGSATKANQRLLDKIPVVVTEEKVSFMRGDDVCKCYHAACHEKRAD